MRKTEGPEPLSPCGARLSWDLEVSAPGHTKYPRSSARHMRRGPCPDRPDRRTTGTCLGIRRPPPPGPSRTEPDREGDARPLTGSGNYSHLRVHRWGCLRQPPYSTGQGPRDESQGIQIKPPRSIQPPGSVGVARPISSCSHPHCRQRTPDVGTTMLGARGSCAHGPCDTPDRNGQ